jgi:diaminopimelate epimerase
MPTVFLTKHHGLGNDFLIALDERNERALAVDGALARQVCDRRRGIGADGLIHGAQPTAAQRAEGIDVVMHLFNSDGSRAELSGNGARCLGQAIATARGLQDGSVVALTDAGRRELSSAAWNAATCIVSIDMGVAAVGPEVPAAVAERYVDHRWGTVDMGNPHLVVLVDDPDEIDLASDGPWIEKHFDEGMNVEFIRPGIETDTIDLRVWERGAGITEACGTGACAAAFTFKQWFPLVGGDAVEVRMPGGEVTVTFGAGDQVTLIGPATFIASVELDEAEVR